jgi:hypothetical protein
MIRFAPVLLVVLVALSGCAGSAGSSSDPPGSSSGGSGENDASPSEPETGAIDHPTGSEAVLVVTSEGGMLPVQMQVTNMPLFVMLGDGRVIVPGVTDLIFPGPALPALQVRQLTEDGIQDVLEAVEATELFAGDLDLRAAQNVVADATDTVFALDAGGRQVRVSAFALGSLSDPAMGEPPPTVSATDIEADAVLRQLMDGLTAIDTSVPPDGWEADGWQTYTPEDLRLYVRDGTGQPVEGGEDLPGQVLDWPTDDDPATFGEEVAAFGEGTRCATVSGDDAATWYAALSEANQQTLWTTDGDDRWLVQVRPLLPHEEVVCP